MNSLVWHSRLPITRLSPYPETALSAAKMFFREILCFPVSLCYFSPDYGAPPKTFLH